VAQSVWHFGWPMEQELHTLAAEIAPQALIETR
jgi:hypothetical protein